MKTLVVFDSNFGNTQRVADCIANQFSGDVHSINVNHIKESDLSGVELLIVGSPINAWNPTKKIRNFLSHLGTAVKGIRGAAFDTRVNSFLSGNAAKKIARSMENSGIRMIAEPAGFFVEDNEGPLKHGELKRAEAWVQSIKAKLG
jgi:flavodoxin